nr:uncharacterized protein LOC109153229 [Ipomoea batatas]
MQSVYLSLVIFSRARLGNAWKMLLDAAETVVPNYDPEAVVSLTKFADQLPSVFNELAQGIAEFKPTPSENLECFKESYSVPCTLLVCVVKIQDTRKSDSSLLM